MSNSETGIKDRSWKYRPTVKRVNKGEKPATESGASQGRKIINQQ